jgi:hypothetical protein
MTIAEDLSFSINTSTSLYAIGFCALKTNTLGRGNTAIGCNTLCVNTTGCNNLAIGTEALKCNTFGCTNTAIGISTLCANISGNANTAIGYYALCSNTIGSQNTAIGCYALARNITGSDNFAVGNNTLYGNLGGSGNVAIGSLASFCNTTGSNNIAVGCNALRCNTIGCNNTALGLCALGRNITGFDNIAVGCFSTYGMFCGSGNIGIGNNTLRCSSTGIGNVAIGQNSMCCGGAGSNNNVAIGCGAMMAVSAADNNVAIGVCAAQGMRSAQNNIAIGCAALRFITYGGINIGIGTNAFCQIGNQSGNIGIGNSAGSSISSGNCNVILGSYNGALINGQNNNIILADGVGTVRMNFTTTGAVSFGTSLTAFGTLGQVLCSNGPGAAPAWATVGGGGGGTAAAGGSGIFNTSISNQVGYTLVGDAFTSTFATTGTGIIATMPSTTATRYILHSLHITNVAASDAEVTGRFELTNGRGGFQLADTTINNASWFASRLPVPSGSAVELLKKPQILYPNDIIRLQSTSANGGGGVNGQLYAYLVFEGSTDYTYQSGNLNLASSSPTTVYNSVLNTGTTTSTAFPSVIESMRVTNYSNVADYRISVAWTNSIGTVQSYLAYNMLIPAYATVEILEKPKRLAAGDLIRATPEAPNVISMQVSGRIITSTFV